MATLRFLLKRFAPSGCWVSPWWSRSRSRSACWWPGRSTRTPRARRSCRPRSRAPPTVRNARFQVFGDDEFDWQQADQLITERTQSLPKDGDLVREGLATVRLATAAGPSVPLLGREGSRTTSRSRPAARRRRDHAARRDGAGAGRAPRGPDRDHRADRRRDEAAGHRHLPHPGPRRSVLLRDPEPVPQPDRRHRRHATPARDRGHGHGDRATRDLPSRPSTRGTPSSTCAASRSRMRRRCRTASSRRSRRSRRNRACS